MNIIYCTSRAAKVSDRLLNEVTETLCKGKIDMVVKSIKGPVTRH